MKNGYLTLDDLNNASELSTNADRQDALALQLKLANALRQKSFAKGNMAGGVYIPPNPLETALDIYDRFQGTKEGSEGTNKMEGLLNSSQNAKLKLLLSKWFPQDKDPAATPDPTANNSDLGGFL